MNKQLHRVIFNAARGVRMAVHEGASSNSGRGRLKATAAVAVVVMLAWPGGMLQAQIVADPNAPANQRPPVLAAPNGVPLVQIQTPSAAGVSRNTYSQFDVGPNGAILNNSRTNVQTQQGGWVQGNPYLARGPARIILNEVNSSNPSQLRGYVEVAGQRAEVIIANPAGIQVQGGGFINASRATLTTGVPQFNAAGSLESFLVRGGTISIDGAGLDASQTDYAAILARAVQVNAGIWASELKVVAGANQVSADGAQATPTAGTGAAPVYALDVAALGGMYGGKISLVGTEAGLGVCNAGHIGAGAGELVVRANGRLENTGVMEAARLELASSGELRNAGTLRQTGSAALAVTAPVLRNAGGTVGPEPVSVAGGSGGDTGTGSTGTGSTGGTPTTGGATEGGGTSSTGTGTTTAPVYVPPSPGAIEAAGGIDNSGGRIYAGGPISLQVPQIDNSSGSLSVQSLAVSGPRFSNAGGTLNVSGDFGAQVGDFDNRGGQLHAGRIDIATTGDFTNGDGALVSDTDMSLSVGGTLRNDGTIVAARHNTIHAGSVQSGAAGVLGAGVRADGSLASEGELRVSSTGVLAAQGTLRAAGSLGLQGAQIDLSGSDTSAAGIALSATQGNVNTSGATVNTPGALSVWAAAPGAAWVNEAGTIQAGQLTASVANLHNTQGGEIVQTGPQSLVLAASDAAGAAGLIDNSGGRIASAGQDLELRAASIINTGGKIEHAASAGTLRIDAGSYSGAGGTIAANGALAVRSTGDFVQDGGTISAQAIDLQAGALSNRGGRIFQTGDVAGPATRIAVGALLDNTGGLIVGNASTAVEAGSLVNQGGTMHAAGNAELTLTVAGALDNTRGQVSGQALRIDTGSALLTNTGGTIAAVDAVDIASGTLVNDAGLIQAGGALTIDTHGQALVNTHAQGHGGAEGGGIRSAGAITLTTGALDNSAGFIGADGAVQAHTQGFVNSGGVVQSATSVAVNSGAGSYDNRAGQTLSGGDLSLAGAAIDNRGGLVRAAGQVALQAQRIDNSTTLDAATPQAALQPPASGSDAAAGHGIEGGNVAIQGTELNNTGGAIRSGGDVHITSGGRVDNSAGLIAANHAVEIVDPAATSAKTLAVANTGGLMVANNLLKLDAKSVGLDGILTSGQDLSVALEQDATNTGELSANANLSLSTSAKLTNSGKLIAGQSLTVHGADIDNTASGEMSAQTTAISASGTLTNRGLIDGGVTRIDAGVLNNIGTGRIYGGALSIAAGALNNLAETVDGQTHAGTIAARQRLDIGAQAINNRDGALIYSDGDMAIGGALDANRRATGSATVLNNHAATIESAGNMAIDAAQLNNTNGGVTWTMQPGENQHVVQYSVPGSSTRYDASEVIFVSSRGRVFDTNDPYSPGDLDYTYLIVPAPEYPVSKFRPYYLNPPAGSQDSSYTVYHGGDAEWWETVHVAGAWYARTDPIWATFGIEPAPQQPDNPFQYPGVQVGDERHVYYTGLNLQERREIVFDHPATQAELEQWQAYNLAYGQAHAALDTAIGKFAQSYQGNIITGQPSRMYSTWDAFDLTVSSATPVLTHSAPARIVAGGQLDIQVSTGVNEMSQILAGGALKVAGGTIVNVNKEVDATRRTHGTVTHSYVVSHSFKDDERRYDAAPYDLTEPSTVTLAAARQEGHQAVAPGRGVAPQASGQASAAALGAGGVNASSRVNPIQEVAAAGGASGSADSRAGGAASLVVRTSAPSSAIPSASLFGIKPAGSYLIEADPRFANYRQWLSSDYLLNTLGLDPNTTLKRLGDGYYEQKLIREQVAQLTGYRYLEGYASDEAQYTALMNAGVTFAQQYGLRPGVALTAAQMAQLTSDIVWLVEQTVTLPDGTTQQVLVPQVYVRVKPGDIDGSGALLSGNSVDMKLTGDVVNGAGTIAGRQLVKIDAQNIANLGGLIQGKDVDLKARQDLVNLGGTIQGQTSVKIDAGRDVIVQSTTSGSGSRQGNAQGGHSQLAAINLDRIAGIYVTDPTGSLDIQAGRDVQIAGAQVHSGGDARVQAGRDVVVSTVQTGRRDELHFSDKNSRTEQSQQSIGSQISAGGNLTLQAGRDLAVIGSDLQAGQTLRPDAKGDITVAAAQNSSQFETHHASGSSINRHTLDVQGSASTLRTSSLQASRIELNSGGETTLAAVRASADSLDIHTGGSLNLLTQSETTRQQEQSYKSNSASTHATQQGRIDQSTVYNQLNVGSLTVQAAGGIRAEVVAGQDLQSLAQQPGMQWVQQLATGPALQGQVDWQRVQEVHTQWRQDQKGLGVGSALVISMIASMAAAPAAAGVGNAAGVTMTTATGSLTSAGAVIQAGVSTLLNQTLSSLASNGWDLGQTLKDLGSSQSIRNLATAVATAGVLQGLGGVLPDNLANATNGSASFTDQLTRQLIDRTAAALVQSAINGTDVGDALQAGLASALLNTFAAQGANQIGTWVANDTIGQFAGEVTHAVLGCGVGAVKGATGGGDAAAGCAAGAIGATVGHLTGQYTTTARDPAELIFSAQLLGGLAGALVTGGDPGGMNIAGAAAGNAVENNRLLHYNEKEAIRTAASGDPQKQQRLEAAACYVVRCWAQYPEGSPLYNQYYVSPMQAGGLTTELAWVQSQQSFGLFKPTTFDKFTDGVAAATGLASDSFMGQAFGQTDTPAPSQCQIPGCENQVAGIPHGSHSIPDGMYTAGISGSAPLVGTVRVGFGVSLANNQWDAGISIDTPILGVGVNNLYFNRLGFDLSYQTGSFTTNNGSISQSYRGGWGAWGFGLQRDPNGVSGGSINFGPQYGVQIGPQETRTLSINKILAQ